MIRRRAPHTIRVAFTGLAALALSGCSDEPSAADMKTAIVSNRKYQTLVAMVGQSLTAAQVEKGGCVAAADATGYICDLRVGFENRGKVEFGQWGKARFFKAGGMWNMEER